MSLPSNDPSTGERVLREAGLSWWSQLPRLVFGVLGLLLVGWGLLRQDRLGNSAAAFGGLAALWFFAQVLLRRRAMRVRLTDRYLVLETGLVSRHTSTVMLNRVESLDVDQSLWQRMTGYGTLTIRGTGSEDLRLRGIGDPVGFQVEARKAINAASGAPL